MDAVEERLVRTDDKLIQLFDPLFDQRRFRPDVMNMCRAT
jgi:hypothetical protein